MTAESVKLEQVAGSRLPDGAETDADWQRRVVGRSLRTAAERSVDRGMNLIRAATAVLARADGEDITVQDVADEAGQSLRTLYQYFESKDDLLLAVFEEAMRAYAHLIEQAIRDFSDPLERLAAAMVAAVRMPEVTGSGVDRGLVRLRLRLSQFQPDLVGRAQAAVTSLVRGLVDAAAADGSIVVADAEAATFMILSLNAAFITAETIGNDVACAGPRSPTSRRSVCAASVPTSTTGGTTRSAPGSGSRLRRRPRPAGPGPPRRGAARGRPDDADIGRCARPCRGGLQGTRRRCSHTEKRGRRRGGERRGRAWRALRGRLHHQDDDGAARPPTRPARADRPRRPGHCPTCLTSISSPPAQPSE